MSQYWKIVLTPLDAYFLGGERNARYGNSASQLSERRPYFIRSNRMLSQSAAFGVLRYLGIRNPRPDFRLTDEDKKNIGAQSYSLTGAGQNYGRISSISPVLLTDGNDRRFVTAPWNRTEAGCDAKTGVGSCRLFASYRHVPTMDGDRWLPDGYNEKHACDIAELICLEDGSILSSPFTGQVRTGINRVSQRLAEQNTATANTPSGFFKKEYVLLRKGYSFLFYAETKDEFFVQRDSVVYIGQGRTPFAAHVEQTDGCWNIKLPSACFPVERQWESATVLSDLYIEGHTDELKSRCSLMIAGSRNFRCMETNYVATSAANRYTKKAACYVIPTGSTFVFCGEDRERQLADFDEYLQGTASWDQARRAGLNYLAYSK